MSVAITVVLLMVVVFGVVVAFGRTADPEIEIPDPDDLSFYQIAYLAGGRKRVALTALAYLVWSGLIEVRPGSRTLALVGPPPSSIPLAPVEEAILRNVPMDGVRAAPVQAAGAVAAEWVEDELVGLVNPPQVALRAVAVAVIPALLALIVSLFAMLVLAALGEPIGLLATVPLVAFVVVVVAWSSRYGVTAAGRRALDAEERRCRAALKIAESGVTSLPVDQGIYVVAVHGRPALTGDLAPLRRVTSP